MDHTEIGTEGITFIRLALNGARLRDFVNTGPNE
jgi:hypothetical protein